MKDKTRDSARIRKSDKWDGCLCNWHDTEMGAGTTITDIGRHPTTHWLVFWLLISYGNPPKVKSIKITLKKNLTFLASNKRTTGIFKHHEHCITEQRQVPYVLVFEIQSRKETGTGTSVIVQYIWYRECKIVRNVLILPDSLIQPEHNQNQKHQTDEPVEEGAVQHRHDCTS